MSPAALAVAAVVAAALAIAAVLARRRPRVAAVAGAAGLALAVGIPMLLHERLRGESPDEGPDPTVERTDSRVASAREAWLLRADEDRLVFRATGPDPLVRLAPRSEGAVRVEVGNAPPRSRPAAGTPIRILVWGDCRGGRGVFERLCEAIEREKPEFTVGLGDLVGMARTYQFEILARRLEETRVATFVVPGNHDRDPFRTLRPFARVFGPTSWWSFEHRGVLFLGLDTSLGVVDVRDLDRLEAAVSSFDAEPGPAGRPVLLFCPPPPFAPTGRDDKTLPHHPATLRLRDFLVRRKVQVFASHFHGYDDREAAPGVRQVTTGGAGSRPEQDVPYHAVGVEIDPDGRLRVRRIDLATQAQARGFPDRLLVFCDEALYALGAFPVPCGAALLGLAAFLGALGAAVVHLVRTRRKGPSPQTGGYG